MSEPDPIAPQIRALDISDVLELVASEGRTGNLDGRVVVYSIHDGDIVPDLFADPPFARDHGGLTAEFASAFTRERDFGADAVACELARELGLASRLRVRLARALLDAGRFFGLDDGLTPHTSRLAVSSDVTVALDRERIEWLNAAHAAIERGIVDTVLAAQPGCVAIGVHTYDPVSPDGSARPALSLLDLPESVARGEIALPNYREPELRSDDLRSTCEPGFMNTLEKGLRAEGHEVKRNDPYLLPNGAIEVRLHHAARRSEMAAPRAFVLEVRKNCIFDGTCEKGWFEAHRAIQGNAARVAASVAAALSRSLRL